MDPDPESRAFRLEQLAVLLYEILVPCCPLYDNLDGDTSAATPAEGRRVVGVCDVSITAATTSGALAILSSALTPPPRVLQYGRQLEGVGITAGKADELRGNGCRTSYMAVVRRDWRYQAACAVAEDLWSRAALALSGKSDGADGLFPSNDRDCGIHIVWLEEPTRGLTA